jgi:hypothetical protein
MKFHSVKTHKVGRKKVLGPTEQFNMTILVTIIQSAAATRFKGSNQLYFYFTEKKNFFARA